MMTAYEFIKAQDIDTERASKYANYMSWVQFAHTIKFRYPEYKQDADYQACKDAYYDVTGSCNRGEVIDQMRAFMVKAIAYGIQTKNLDWRTKFISAYEILTSVSRGDEG